MAKTIRIENADTSNHRVVVEVWEKPQDGGHAKKIGEFPLDHPTAMTTQPIWKNHFLIVKEV